MEGGKELAREENFMDLFGGSLPDAMFVLPAEMERRKRRWSTISYVGKDSRGFMAGGKARAVAAAELFSHFPDMKIIPCSIAGTPEKDPDAPSQAWVLAQDLKRFGVAEEKIILEQKSFNTKATLIEIVKWAYAFGWDKVAILSSNYHIPRLQEMFNRLGELAGKEDGKFLEAWEYFNEGKKLEVSFIGAEDVLPQRSAHYEHLIEKVKETDAYKERVDAEKRGLEDLREGRYK